MASLDRLNHFFYAQDIDKNNMIRNSKKHKKGTVIIKNGDFTWDSIYAALHHEETKKIEDKYKQK